MHFLLDPKNSAERFEDRALKHSPCSSRSPRSNSICSEYSCSSPTSPDLAPISRQVTIWLNPFSLLALQDLGASITLMYQNCDLLNSRAGFCHFQPLVRCFCQKSLLLNAFIFFCPILFSFSLRSPPDACRRF